MDEDYALALQLQSEFFQEGDFPKEDNFGSNTNAGEPTNLVDPYWELTDPNPDIRALFLQFNERFFWGRLAGIEIRWSPRMTLCAGLCCYEGRGGLCSVRLSVPLLKLRPRKDLVETLLHEMIHAYLFVTDNNKDHDGHGPEFHKHMYRINKEAGTSISVYHNFHDEVEACRQHWWRCDGPCRSRKPYFGFVKRSMNRAPSKNDTWWAEHQRSCGGTYTKVKEPEGYGKKKGKTDSEDEKKKDKGKSSVKSMDIRIFGGAGKTLGGNKKDSISATKSVADDDKIPIPSSSLTAPVNKSVNNTWKDNSTDQGFGSKNNISMKSPLHGGALPGGKTPKKDAGFRNKPVSQGGTAKFNEKKKVFHLPDFSDSDDELLASIPLDDLSANSVDDSNDSDTQGKIYGSDEMVTDLPNVDDSLDTMVADTGTLPAGDKHSDEISTQAAQEKAHSEGSLTHNNEADEVRTMLRKVWGQKQFEIKLPVLSLKSFGSGDNVTDGKLRTGVNNFKTKTTYSGNDKNSVINPNKRLSDASSEINPPVKRQRSGDMKTSKTGASNRSNEENVKPKPNTVTSPIDKYFSRTVSVNSQVSNPQQTSTSYVSSQNVNSSVMGDNSNETRPTEEKSTCPICNKLVVISTINDHLDLCLTMQAI